MNRYRLARLADTDLDEIWRHVASDNVTAADGLTAKLFDTFQLLATHPKMGEPRSEFRRGEFRCFSVGNYVIFFRHAEGVVEIARIVHGARDISGLA
jgi:toxin ParE1/3/4